MRKLTFGLLTALLVVCSCSQDDITTAIDDKPATPATADAKNPVRLNITRADGVDVSQVSIYAYISERKKDSLVYAKTLDLGDGNLQIELPLGESIKAFAVANAGSVTAEDSLCTVTVNQDASCTREIYLSEIASFNSDYTTSAVELTLSRLVGQVVVQPKETDLSAAKFDQADITLKNLGLAYKVSTGEIAVGDITLSANAAQAWTVSAYSFPTTDLGSTKIYMQFLNGGQALNTSLTDIDTENTIGASMRLTVTIPYLDEEYLSAPWTTRTAGGKICIETTNM